MQKDVIYIDVDDDITAIIGKIKESKEKIVALVPPKRAGVLQSAVNLRLLERMAKADKKHLVIITNNPALVALTAAAKIPVAKNLQSKPEIAEIAALKVDGDDDIIDGADLPIGDHAEAVGTSAAAVKPTRNDAIETLEIDGGAEEAASRTATTPKKPKVNIPNFDSFRKRLVLIIVGVVLLTAGLVWAFVFAPAATIIITASTTPAPLSASVKLGGTAATDAKAGIISSEKQELKRDATTQITPTGKAKTGTKATGTVTMRSCGPPRTVPAGTILVRNGNQYALGESVSFGYGFCGGAENVVSDIAITAAEVGAEYNIANGSTLTVNGFSATGPFALTAQTDSAVSGGTSKEITTVSDDDIERAIGQLIGQSTDSVKAELKKQFKDGQIVIDGSFTADRGEVKVSPEKGQEVPEGTKATLTLPMTYSIYAFSKSAITTYLDAAMQSQVTDKATQKVYDNGLAKVSFGNFQKAQDGAMTVTIATTGQIGPKIDEAAIKEQVKGKITGDVQRIVENINGVRDVQVNYSYFWVRTVPNDTNKIQIEFELENA